MCQLEWIRGCSDTWLNFFVDVSVKMFPDELSVWILLRIYRIFIRSDVAVSEHHSLLPRQKVKQGESCHFFSASLMELEHSSHLLLHSDWFTPPALLILRALDSSWSTSDVLEFQVCKDQIVELHSLHNHMRKFFIIKFVIHWIYFSREICYRRFCCFKIISSSETKYIFYQVKLRIFSNL